MQATASGDRLLGVSELAFLSAAQHAQEEHLERHQLRRRAKGSIVNPSVNVSDHRSKISIVSMADVVSLTDGGEDAEFHGTNVRENPNASRGRLLHPGLLSAISENIHIMTSTSVKTLFARIRTWRFRAAIQATRTRYTVHVTTLPRT
ncbi:hypothetical protein JG688_00008641 [Phytophthora aleatoria]|uniref:Uncharacterized protein n=1 Tax=Phytophthora aleatoria TaxID=2496075 RepID=A0A8J5M790_9STRA|nr:hypothetical protein JG688_00008641 [Phytophthora aleatoria]